MTSREPLVPQGFEAFRHRDACDHMVTGTVEVLAGQRFWAVQRIDHPQRKE
jgi:hypothetical protein